MRIKNGTRYDTRTLRKIFTEVHKRFAKYEGRLPQWKHLLVDVRYSRTKWRSSGYAYIRGTLIVLRMQQGSMGTLNLAKLFDHELQHSYGFQHKSMVGGKAYYSDNYNKQFVWAEEKFGRRLEEKPEPTKVKHGGLSLQEHRHGLVLAGITRWEKKLKYAQSKLRTLRQKKRYYERALAAKNLKGKSNGQTEA